MILADSVLIRWLFDESGISRYQISKDTGIPESTLSRIAGGATDMSVVRFGIAARLTGYAERCQQSMAADTAERLINPDDINDTKKEVF